MSDDESEQVKVEGQSPVDQASPEAAIPASPSHQDVVPASDDAHVDDQMDVEHDKTEEVEEEEEEQVETRSEAARYPPVPAQVLQNVRDLKDEILSGQHPTIQAPVGGPDADEEENEDKVDVVLKSFETKRDEEDEQQGHAQDGVKQSEQDTKTGVKRDVENMLTASTPRTVTQVPALSQDQGLSEREPKRARHDQDQGGQNRTNGDASFRKPSFSDSRASRGELRPPPPGRSRSGSRTYTDNSQGGTAQNDRYLGPNTRGGRSYNSDRNSVSNRSAATSYTDRLSTDSSRRDQERDRIQEARSQRDFTHERGPPAARDGRDFRRPERDMDDRRLSSGPHAASERDAKPALRDRITGAPPVRRPSPPTSIASNGTRYSKPPIPNPDYFDRRAAKLEERKPPAPRDRFVPGGAPPGNTPGYDRREVSRTSSMPDRVSEARSFPPKNSTSYGDLRESGPPASRPPYSDRSRVSPPPSSIGSRYTKPPCTYRDDGPPRSNPNVNYSRPPVPRDPIGPPPARGSSPPPRRPYEAPVGNSPASNRPYGYAANPSGPPEPYAGGRPGYDRYAPPGDAYRERDRTADYRGLPAAVVVPPADRYYPAAAAPLPPADPYVRSAYERQPPQYDRYGRPIPLEQPLPPTYASPARAAAPYVAPAAPASSVLDAELMDLKVRMAELERRREAEKMVAVAAPPPRAFSGGPPDLSYGGGTRGGLPSDRGYPPREREREREREPVAYYPPRNGPPPANARDSAYGPPRNGPGDLPPRNMPMHRGPPRRSPPPLGRDDRPRR